MPTIRDFAAEVSSICGKGSGCLIAPGLVMTALHNVIDREADDAVPDAVECRVRFESDVNALLAEHERDVRPTGWVDRLNPHREELENLWLRARLVWPPQATPTTRWDIAVVKLEEADLNDNSIAHHDPELSVASAFERRSEVEGIGYPNFRTLDGRDGSQRQAVRFFADCDPYESDATRARGLRVHDIIIRSETPDKPDGWKGISGALALSEDGVVGVVFEAAARTSKNDLLGIMPLAWIDPGDDFWTITGLKRGRARTGPRFEPDHHLVDLDRESEETVFRNALDAFIKGGGLQAKGVPGIVLIAGHRADELDLCVERFARILRESYPDAGNCYADVAPFELESSSKPADLRRETLLRQWAEAVSHNPGGSVGDYERSILAAIASPHRPRLIKLQHTEPDFTDGCVSLLRQIAELVHRFAPTSPPPVIFITIVVGTKWVDEQDRIRKIFAHKRDNVLRLLDSQTVPELPLDAICRIYDLEDCSSTTVDIWLRQVEGQGWRLAPGSKRRLRELSEYFRVPLAVATDKLRDHELVWERI